MRNIVFIQFRTVRVLVYGSDVDLFTLLLVPFANARFGSRDNFEKKKFSFPVTESDQKTLCGPKIAKLGAGAA